MAGPWEQYAAPAPTAPPAGGKPWEQYAAPAAAPRAATPADIPSGDPYRKATQADVDNAARLRDEGNVMQVRDTPLGRLVGGVEPALTMGSSLAGNAIGNLYGIGKAALNGQYGTEAGVRAAKKTAEDVAGAMTYEPRTDTGKAGLKAIAQLAAPLEGLQGIGSADALLAGQAVRSSSSAVRNLARANAAAQGAEDVATATGGGKLRDLVRDPQKPLVGVGAAATPAETLRVAAADQLPIPMGGLMTKGMRTRDKTQLANENIWAKDAELGKGLRNRTVEVNQAALDNFDAFADATGAQGSGLRPTGKVVDDYLVKRVADAKTEIRKAYKAADESAEGAAPASYKPLQDYLKKYQEEADTGNAPVLNTVQKILERLDPEGTGTVPVSAYNEIRERVGSMAKTDTKNSPYGKPLQEIIDAEVEAKGGPLYRTARRQYENYQNEFKNAGAIDRLLRAKPGTKDRATALEDVVTKSTLDAPSTDAVRQVKTTLTRKQDPEGLQAWKEVQGETARQIKERVTKGSALDENSAREVSPAALDKIVRELDADGRLQVIFGKQGAQQWRDLRDTIQHVKTIPAGTVSSSGTAEVLAGLLDTAVSGFTGLPLPVASGLNYGVKRFKKASKTKKINEALNPDGGQ